MKSFLVIILAFFSVATFAKGKELKTYYENGALKSKYVYSDASNYEVINYYSNGKLMEAGKFVNGKMDGLWISYNVQGMVAGEANYLNGEKSGDWKIYDDSGSLRYKITYSANRIVNAVNYDAAGNSIADTKTH
jgi:antitoxin component YwqK of YwqJK toxin-antitoxin module